MYFYSNPILVGGFMEKYCWGHLSRCHTWIEFWFFTMLLDESYNNLGLWHPVL